MNQLLKKRCGTAKFIFRLSQRGATAVEFAIIFPLLIILIFAMIEFGLYLFNRQVITNACREGVRFGVVSREPRRTNAEIQNEVLSYAQQHLVTFGSDTLESDDVVIKPVDDDMSDGFDKNANRCTSFEVTYDNGGTPTTYRCELEVQIDYRYDFLFLPKLLEGIIPTYKMIHGQAKMRME